MVVEQLRDDSLIAVAVNGSTLLAPQHWKISKVKHIANYVNGFAFKPSEWSSSGLEIIRIQNLTTRNTSSHRFQGELPDKFRVREGDILISWSASLGVFVWHGDDGWLNQHIFKATPHLQLVTRQYFRWLAQWFIHELQESTHGSTMQHLTRDKFGSFQVFLPPLSEQEQIAQYLSTIDVKVARLIHNKRRLIALLNEEKQAIIQQAVTRGLDPDVPLKPSGVEWLGDIPAHWEVRRAKFLLEEVDRRSIAGEEELLSVSHITGVTPRSQKSVTMFKASSYAGHKLALPGDLVINTMWAWMGALGVSSDTGIVSPSYATYKLRSLAQFAPGYVEAMSRMPRLVWEFHRRSTGVRSSRLRLYPDQFLDVSIPLPPISEQSEVVQYLQYATREIDDAIDVTKQQIDLIREYRTRLISDVVTGQLDVRDVKLDEDFTVEDLDLRDVELLDEEDVSLEENDEIPEEETGVA